MEIKKSTTKWQESWSTRSLGLVIALTVPIIIYFWIMAFTRIERMKGDTGSRCLEKVYKKKYVLSLQFIL